MNAAEYVRVLAIMSLSQDQKVSHMQISHQLKNWALMSQTRKKMNDLGKGVTFPHAPGS